MHDPLHMMALYGLGDKAWTGHVQHRKHRYFSLVSIFFRSGIGVASTEHLVSVSAHPKKQAQLNELRQTVLL